MLSVTAVGDGLVAVGSEWESIVWTSSDGIAWTQVPNDEAVFGEGMFKVTTGGPGVVVLGRSGRPAMWVATPTDKEGAP
jgi:hypothetical protein